MERKFAKLQNSGERIAVTKPFEHLFRHALLLALLERGAISATAYRLAEEKLRRQRGTQ